jgi:hypothetical protein
VANNTYVAIQTITVGATAVATMEFSSIPQTFTDLVIKVSGKPNSGGTGALAIQFNSTTSTHTTKRLYGDGSSTASDSSATTNYLKVGFVGDSSGTSIFGTAEIYIPNYTSANQKSVSTDSAAESNTTTQYMAIMAGLWNGTGAITNIKINGDNGVYNFVQHTTATLYGIKNS